LLVTLSMLQRRTKNWLRSNQLSELSSQLPQTQVKFVAQINLLFLNKINYITIQNHMQ
jgi:hypothetical protein